MMTGVMDEDTYLRNLTLDELIASLQAQRETLGGGGQRVWVEVLETPGEPGDRRTGLAEYRDIGVVGYNTAGTNTMPLITVYIGPKE